MSEEYSFGTLRKKKSDSKIYNYNQKKLKKHWVVVGIILFFTVPGFLFLAIPALIFYSILKAKDPSKANIFDFLFENPKGGISGNTTIVGERKHYVVPHQKDDVRGVGLEGSGALKKFLLVGGLLFGLLIIGLFAVSLFAFSFTDLGNVPVLSDFSSVISIGLLIFGLLVVFIFVKLSSRRDERV